MSDSDAEMMQAAAMDADEMSSQHPSQQSEMQIDTKTKTEHFSDEELGRVV